MKCTSYYREDATLTYDEYKDMTFQILKEYKDYQWESMKVRKLRFVGEYNLNTTVQVTYDICMKNMDENQIYLERITLNNGRYFKSCTKLSKEEVEKILADDIAWMEHHKNPLLTEFYLQKSVNQLIAGPMTDYTREIIAVAKKGYIIFNKEVYRESVAKAEFFGNMVCPIPCVGLHEVHYEYKQKASIPVVLSHMLQQQEETYEQVALCL